MEVPRQLCTRMTLRRNHRVAEFAATEGTQ